MSVGRDLKNINWKFIFGMSNMVLHFTYSYFVYICFIHVFVKYTLFSCHCYPLTLSQTTHFRLSKLKEFADDNTEFDEIGRKFSKRVENTVGKGEIACYKQFLLFAQCFQKTCTADRYKTRLVWACFGKGNSVIWN